MGSSVRQPDMTYTMTSAALEVANTDYRTLIIGQITDAGSVADQSLTENIGNEGTEDALFGASSQAASMVRAFKKINTVSQLDVLALDDASGTPETKVVTFGSGPAASSGTYYVTIGSKTNHRLAVGVTIADTVTEIGDAVEAACLADTRCPFTASNAAGVVTFTADNEGLLANDLPVEVEGTITDVTVAVVASGVGATDPTINAALFALLGDRRYQGIIFPYSADHAVATTFLESRFNASNIILDGVAFTHITDDYAAMGALAAATNSQTLVIFGDEAQADPLYKGPSLKEPMYDAVAQFVAVRALRMTEGASLSQWLTTTAAKDQYGGMSLASLPYFNTVLDLPVILDKHGWSNTQMEGLHDLGIAVIGRNIAGDGPLVGEVPTTYLTDGASNPDSTWKYLNVVDTVSGCREYFHTNSKSRFAQCRLTTGTVNEGRAMANGPIIQAYLEKLYQQLADLSLVEDGADKVQDFKDSIVISIAMATGTATAQMEIPPVTQFRTLLATIQVVFSSSTTGG